MKTGIYAVLGSVCLIVGTTAMSAELFVGGGAYSNLASAVAAATTGDTITIRGGYSTAGATVNKRLTVRAEFNHSIGASDPADMTQPNPARGLESVVTSPMSLKYSPSASGTEILGLYFSIPTNYVGGGSVIHFPDAGSGTTRVSGVTIRNCRFKCLSTTLNGWVGIGGGFTPFADGVVVENNRLGTLMLNNASALFVQGSNWTIRGNYINHNADGGRTTENGRRGFNIYKSQNIVIADNLFKDLGGVAGNSWALQPNDRCGNIVVANNRFDGCARDFAFYPAGANFLIAANTTTNIAWGLGGGGYSLDLLPGANGFPTGDAMSNLVVRHNACDVNMATGDKAFRWALIRPYANVVSGSILIERNAVSVRGTAGTNTSARGGIRFGSGAGIDRFDLCGPITIRDNVMDSRGYAVGVSNVPSIGFFFAGTTGGRTNGGMSLTAVNNRVQGFTRGACVDTAYTGWSPGTLPTGDSALLQNNNFLNNTLGVEGGVGGAGVDIGGSYFSGNTMNTNGNVTGAAGGSVNPVAGRDPAYVAFRGDHNLDDVVDEADAAIITNNWGASGPGVTYFSGDSTLDQVVSLADGKVYARFYGQPIAGSGVVSNGVSAGAPVIRYDPMTGTLSLDASVTTDEIWGIRLNFVNGAPPAIVAVWPQAIHTNWMTATPPGTLEFGDRAFGTRGAFAPHTRMNIALLWYGLTSEAFGSVEYFFGQTNDVGSAFTSVKVLQVGSYLHLR